MGFDVANGDLLRAALLDIAREGVVKSAVETRFGWKYVVDGYIEGPSGTEALVRTVWIVDTGSRQPRLVTAYPGP